MIASEGGTIENFDAACKNEFLSYSWFHAENTYRRARKLSREVITPGSPVLRVPVCSAAH